MLVFRNGFAPVKIFNANPSPLFSAALNSAFYLQTFIPQPLFPCLPASLIQKQSRAQYNIAVWLCQIPSKNGSFWLNLQWSLQQFLKAPYISETRMHTWLSFSLTACPIIDKEPPNPKSWAMHILQCLDFPFRYREWTRESPKTKKRCLRSFIPTIPLKDDYMIAVKPSIVKHG